LDPWRSEILVIYYTTGNPVHSYESLLVYLIAVLKASLEAATWKNLYMDLKGNTVRTLPVTLDQSDNGMYPRNNAFI
jgi:hypothetical protein